MFDGRLLRELGGCSGEPTHRHANKAAVPVRLHSDAAQADAAEASRLAYGAALERAGKGPITTEVRSAPELFHAEEHHQQYLHKNPGGYCGLGGTGVSCPIGTGVDAG